MARRRVDDTPVEGAVEEPAVEAVQDVQEAPVPAPPVHDGKPGKPRPVFDGDPDEVHRKYFIPPVGYQKPKFPSSI